MSVSIKNPKCTQCGGDYENGICSYCGHKNLEIANIKSLISSSDDIVSYYDKVRKKVFEGQTLDQSEDAFFYLLLKNDMVKDECLDDARILAYIFHGKKIIPYNTFEVLMLRVAEKNMREISAGRIENYDPKAYIRSLEGANGSAFEYYSVSFDKEIIKELYNGAIAPLSTYYHEIEHVAQAMAIYLGYINSDLMLALKEKIISYYEFKTFKTDYYYKRNYFDISYEIDAHHVGIYAAKHFLYNVCRYNNLDDYFEILRKAWPESKNTLKRVVIKDGKEIYKTVDEIFHEIIISNPKYLEKYPQLNIEYINEDGNIRKRTKEELLNILDKYSNDSNAYAYIEFLIANLNEEKKM